MAQKKKRRKAPTYLVILVVFGLLCTAGLAVAFWAHLDGLHDTPRYSLGPALEDLEDYDASTPLTPPKNN